MSKCLRHLAPVFANVAQTESEDGDNHLDDLTPIDFLFLVFHNLQIFKFLNLRFSPEWAHFLLALSTSGGRVRHIPLCV